ncbi:MAG: DUF4011 domain-containing protein [Gemmatimonadetes bacterium]|nr:DUF4011 domain-containing protein [Gemmatimonadota bacterium]
MRERTCRAIGSGDLVRPSRSRVLNPQATATPIGKSRPFHYPDDLEVILRKISGAARLAIEETGSNMLYLIFGFLEWYETEDSELARFAPLLLLPVGLQKGDADVTGSIRYSIHHSGKTSPSMCRSTSV